MSVSLFDYDIAWKPGTDQVALVQKPMVPTVRQEYSNFWGIHRFLLEDLTNKEVSELILVQALNLIVNYHCDPQAVHQVFLQLEEYAAGWADFFTIQK